VTTRRNVLKLAGGGVVLAAAAGGAVIASAGPSQAARRPWGQAGQYDEYRRRALSYAILAPNPHNRQPWTVSLDGDDALRLFCDLDRRLPATDPFDRQITIGCGAFLELLRIAAAEEGYEAVITPFPEGEDAETLDQRPVAKVVFSPGAAKRDPLFPHILARRSNKEVYSAQAVPAAALAELRRAGAVHDVACFATDDEDLTARLRDLVWRAQEREMTTPAAAQESVDLMRIGADEVTRNPDGIELEGPMFEVGRRLGLITRKTLGDPSSMAFGQGLEMYRALAMSGTAFGWIINANASRADQLNAGRAYVRVNLSATALGLAMHPWSQALQEYPEMADLFTEAHGLVKTAGRLQMLYRIGYAKPIGPTPRHALETHIAENERTRRGEG
jgi:hypothetical protein